MKLLITTQVVDKKDSQLGFFHRWVEEFAKHCEQIIVICLKEGEHTLPQNVKVISLGKEYHSGAYHGTMRLTYSLRFLRYVLAERKNYDNVFVHMNPEYIVLAGWLWRLWGKKIVLWYTHKSVNLKLRIAAFFANDIATASKESFRLHSNKVHVLGHGIDTAFFSPDPGIERGDWLLSVGRLSKSKRHDMSIRMSLEAGKELHIAGEGPERKNLESLAHQLHAKVHFLGGLTQVQLLGEYRKAAYLVHTSETGSMDKVVLEALASGLPIKTNDPALKHLESATIEDIKRDHSLPSLIDKIITLYRA